MPRSDLNKHAWKQIRSFILQRDNNTCHYCGKPANTVDHVIPVSQGGDNDYNNLVAACAHCNYSKGGRVFLNPRATSSASVSFLSQTDRFDQNVQITGGSDAP